MSFLGRRQTPEQRRPARVLTAAGRRLDLESRKQPPARAGRAQWQESAWEYRDSIGEIRYAVAFLRHQSSRVRLFPALAQPDGAAPVPLDEAEGVPASVMAAARDAIARLTSGTYQYSALLAPYAENLEVVGEANLVGYTDESGDERWEIRSTDEVEHTDHGWVLNDAPGQRDGRSLDPATSYLARLWHPHARWRALADSPMRSILGPCEELQLVTRMIRGASRSRLAGAGLLLLPEEITFKKTRPPGDDDPEDVEDDDFMSVLTEAMLTGIQDEGDASSVVPITVTAAAEALKEVRHLTLTGPVDEKLLNRVEAALRRIGMALDVPPEIITGMADTNHWSAWQIDDSTTRQHIAPLCERMVDGLTAGYLRPVLAEYGVPAEWAQRVVIWFDVGPLTQRPDRWKDASEAHDRLAISDEALRGAGGFSDDDKPDEEELGRRLALKRGTVDGPLTEALLQLLLLQGLQVERPTPIAIGAGPAAENDAPEVPAGEGVTPGPTTGLPASAAPQGPVLRAHRRESARLSRIDSDLRERLTTAADAAVTRAVERAGARVRSAGNRDPELRARLASLPAAAAPAALGQAVVAGIGLDVEQLLAGAWDDLAGRWDQWTTTGRTQALAAAARLAGQDPDDPAVAAAAAALTEHASTAWAWLTERLTELATTVLYDPEQADGVATDAEAGEDPSRAGRLTSLIRGALAIAGGLAASAGGVTRDGTPAQAGDRLGGIGSGDVVHQYLRTAGQEILGYEWVYGISERHFEPHRDLDGVLFADFASPVLANPIAWPHPILAPGDHRGCHCDAAPIWADGTLSSDQQQAAGDATYDDSYLQVLAAIAADDTAAGRSGTSPQRTVAEADRIADSRPSRRP